MNALPGWWTPPRDGGSSRPRCWNGGQGRLPHRAEAQKGGPAPARDCQIGLARLPATVLGPARSRWPSHGGPRWAPGPPARPVSCTIGRAGRDPRLQGAQRSLTPWLAGFAGSAALTNALVGTSAAHPFKGPFTRKSALLMALREP